MFFSIALLIVIFFIAFKVSPVENKEHTHIHGAGQIGLLAAVALLAGDGGSGSEMGGLLQELFSQDAGGGADGVRILTGKAGHDLKLHPHRGQVSITHKEVNL